MSHPDYPRMLRELGRARRVLEVKRIGVEDHIARLRQPREPAPNSADGRVLTAALDHLATIQDADYHLRGLATRLEALITPRT